MNLRPDKLELVCSLPLRLVSVMNAREHWARRARRAADHRAATRMALAAHGAWPLRLPLDVTITRIAPRVLDGDNLQGAAKAVRDGIADALGVDDRDPRVRWIYGQRRGTPGQHAVELRIAEIRVSATHEGDAA